MAVDVICPECGGIIGATGVDANGRGPCTCRSDGKTDGSDTVSIPSPSQYRDPVESAPKLCISCGKNVAGHRRVKDSRGYLCYDCAKGEIRQEREGTVPCAECGRRVKPAGIVEYGGIRICRKCYEDHKESQKKAVKKVATRHYEAHEKRNLLILTAVFVALGLIVLWRQLIAG